METILLLFVGIIGIIVLICFFILCSNVASIKKILRGHDWEKYDKHSYWGRKEEALKALQDEVWFNLKDIRANTDEQTFKKRLETLRGRYESRLIELGGSFPEPDYVKTFVRI